MKIAVQPIYLFDELHEEIKNDIINNEKDFFSQADLMFYKLKKEYPFLPIKLNDLFFGYIFDKVTHVQLTNSQGNESKLFMINKEHRYEKDIELSDIFNLLDLSVRSGLVITPFWSVDPNDYAGKKFKLKYSTSHIDSIDFSYPRISVDNQEHLLDIELEDLDLKYIDRIVQIIDITFNWIFHNINNYLLHVVYLKVEDGSLEIIKEIIKDKKVYYFSDGSEFPKDLEKNKVIFAKE